ncbi:UNVERIFIED_ORG: hypothetical protein J2Y81_008018 [Paraburkholderia sediminicola]|nr:hypothetical protein [Paraburkholderia sediminicola]
MRFAASRFVSYLQLSLHFRQHAGNATIAARRNKAAAQRYFEKSIQQNGVPETVTIDKSGANLAALHAVNAERDTPIKIRQVKYLNNVVEQDHRAIKRIVRPMLGFKDFRCARVILSGIEIMHMIVIGQMKYTGKIKPSAACQFYSLVTYAILIMSPLYDSTALSRQNREPGGQPSHGEEATNAMDGRGSALPGTGQSCCSQRRILG